MDLTPLALSTVSNAYAVRIPEGGARGLAAHCVISGPLAQHIPASRFSRGSWAPRFACLQPAAVLAVFDAQDDAEPRGVTLLGPSSTVDVVGGVEGGSNVIAVTAVPGGKPTLLSCASVHDARAGVDGIMRSRASCGPRWASLARTGSMSGAPSRASCGY